MYPMPPGRRPPGPWPFPPRGDPDRRPPPTPTLREMQMQAAHRGRGPGDWQAGGMVGRNMMNPRAGAYAARQRFPTTPPLPSEIGYVVPPIPPRDWQEGGVVDYASNFAPPWERDVDPSESLMAERESLQQLLQQTTDEVTAQEILMQIREITKELEMAAAGGMANGGIASLMGGVRGYQGGGAPRRTGALHGSILGDPSSGRWTEHFPVGSFRNPIYSGWGTVDTTRPGLTKTSFKPNLPFPNRPPPGGG